MSQPGTVTRPSISGRVRSLEVQARVSLSIQRFSGVKGRRVGRTPNAA